MLNKIKTNKKGGFTLVELIVVLVILAILAALLVPALTGYIDKANEKEIVAATRQAVMAAQTLADEAYAKDADVADADVTVDAIKTLAEVDGTIEAVDITDNTGKVAGLTYQEDGKQCVYTASTGEYVVTTVTE